uniref:Uncharacterized protein n=1 Tax=Globodera rostochiensis TaxID=31243 RepID=A0A914H1Y1_GLORO
MLLFWPLTDDDDVEEKDDWDFCCGTIHSFIGSFLFIFADLIGLPSLLAIYCAMLYYLNGNFVNVHFIAPILALVLGIITSFSGAVSFVRLYACLFQHRCSSTHDRIVVYAMKIYFWRLIFFTLFSLCYVAFIIWQMFGGPRNVEDICDWERLWGFFNCVWVWVRLTLLAIAWTWMALQYGTATWCCCVALKFVQNRYRGYYDDDSASPSRGEFANQRYEATYDEEKKWNRLKNRMKMLM